MKKLCIKLGLTILFTTAILLLNPKPVDAIIFCSDKNVDPVNSGIPNPMKETYGGYVCNTGETMAYPNPSVVNWKPQMVNWGEAFSMTYRIVIFRILDNPPKPWYNSCVNNWMDIDNDKMPQEFIHGYETHEVFLPLEAGVPGSGVPAVELNHTINLPDEWGPAWYQIDVQPSCDGGSSWVMDTHVGGTFIRKQDRCTLDLNPDSQNIIAEQTGSANAAVTVKSGNLQKVEFTSSPAGIVSVTSPSLFPGPYSTTITAGTTIGSTNVTANAIFDDGKSWCTDTAAVSVIAPGAWWQAIDGDVITNGRVVSSIPTSASKPIIEKGPGGYPGIATFLGNISPAGNISELNWNAKTSYHAEVPDFDFFRSRVPPDDQVNEITNSNLGSNFFKVGSHKKINDYYWYYYDGSTLGDLKIEGNNDIGNRKVILFVDSANLLLNQTINLDKGKGFFMAIVGKSKTTGAGGNIVISHNVNRPVTKGSEIEGLFFAEGTVTAEAGPGSSKDHSLNIRGSIIALAGVNFQRTLHEKNTELPAEEVEFAPDIIMNYPKELLPENINWKEIAP
jgi:hypothetical protein